MPGRGDHHGGGTGADRGAAGERPPSRPDTGERQRFKSSIVPPWARKSPKVAEVLPLLYLHGLSTGDFAPALGEFFGTSAGLSPSVITRLTTQWQTEHRAFMERDLSDRGYVYVWVDGVHFNVWLAEDRLCCLVIVGVRLDGTKELVALADGYGSRPSRGPICCAISAAGDAPTGGCRR
jgi:putative transposase